MNLPRRVCTTQKHGSKEKSVALPLVAFLAASLSIFGSALPRIVNLGSVSQADGMDPIFLILIIIITEVNLNFIKGRSLSFGSFCLTLTMSESLFILLPLEHGLILIIENTR
jgi:hypothetical protein